MFSVWIVPLIVAGASVCCVATAGKPGDDELVIAAGGRANAIIVVSPEAGCHERHAADDLSEYIGLMCGAEPRIASTQKAIDAAMAGRTRPSGVVSVPKRGGTSSTPAADDQVPSRN